MTYIFKKLCYLLVIILGVTTVIFLIFNVLPGDPSKLLMGQRQDSATEAVIRKQLGLDEPLYKRYIKYIDDVSPISVYNSKNTDSFFYLSSDYEVYAFLFSINNASLVIKKPYLGRSYVSQKKVGVLLSETLPSTILLAFTAIFIASVLGIFLGILSGIYQGSWVDKTILSISVLGVAGPSFFISIILAWLFGLVLKDYTGLNMTGSLYDIDPFLGESIQLKNLILPSIALGIRPLSVIIQLTRNEFLDIMKADFIRTARAKGLSEKTVLVKHALRNTLNPIVTALSSWLSGALAGSVFVEYVFGWNGVGKEVVDALEKFDFPVLMGSILVFAIFFAVISVLVDILYTYIDPRVKL